MNKDEISKEIEATENRLRALREKLNAPVEKEYRAGEWVPKRNRGFHYVSVSGKVYYEPWRDTECDEYLLSQGNVYPTEAIAEAANKHSEFWRTFDMADEGGEWGIFVEDGRLLVEEFEVFDGTPRWNTSERASNWVITHGGEAYVSEMLTKGRVFRFKWGGE